MVYIDTPFRVSVSHPTAPACFKGQQSAHLMADSESELIAYAKRLGMQEHWIQKRGTAAVHFDVMGARLAQVLADPAVNRMTRREIAVMIRSRHAKTRKQRVVMCPPTTGLTF
jgi:hypothetical protein